MREATAYVISAVPAEISPPSPERPIEFQETPDPPQPNACEPCLVARIPTELRNFAEAEARERAIGIAGLGSRAPSAVLAELVLELLRISTDVPTDLSRVLAVVIDVLEFLCRPSERTYANVALIRDLVGTDAGWRQVNRNRARWQYLPEAVQDLLMRLDAVTEAFEPPAFAERARLTPEALLARARALASMPPTTW